MMKPGQGMKQKTEDLCDKLAFVSQADFDNIEQAFLQVAAEARSAVIGECAEIAEQYWKEGKNTYARHAGRAVEARIRLLSQAPDKGWK